MFAANVKDSGERKDNVVNAERTGEFCWSLGAFPFSLFGPASLIRTAQADRLHPVLAATYDLREEMNKSATEVPYGTDEFDLAGLEKALGSLVKCPFVKASPINVRTSVLQGPMADPLADPAPPAQFECVHHSTIRLPGDGVGASVDVSSSLLLCPL